ncbi:MAG: class I SAM-dependent methyltransferase [Xenococcaceae cyanobacterium MO_188.B32]|nr:class I SAM-dependent methyltransferase [Xenococcaceae cyanobacterium MO_188.B32]
MALMYEDAVFLQKLINYMNKYSDGHKAHKKTAVFLGNPGSNITYSTFSNLLDRLRIECNQTIKSKKNQNQKIGIRDFFSSLGFDEFKAIDFSDYEGADIVHNLNNINLPEKYHSIADLIFDTGTLEHCFNIPNALQNIHKILKENGVIVHVHPVNGYVDHGFYQISPTLLHDYYGTNQYKILGFVICPEVHYKYSKYYFKMQQYSEDVYWKNGYDTYHTYNKIPSHYPRAILCFAAQKTSKSTCSQQIIQSWYRQVNSLENISYNTSIEFNYEIKKPIPIFNFSFLRLLKGFSSIEKTLNLNFDLYYPN